MPDDESLMWNDLVLLKLNASTGDAMEKVCKDIFRAIHEGKWISVEYRNKDGETTFYWIGIKAMDPVNKSLTVDGVHLSTHEVRELWLYVESIKRSEIIDGSYYDRPEPLIEDIREHPSKYAALFGNAANLRVLRYFSECSRLDATPYKTEYTIIEKLDLDIVRNGTIGLTNTQFAQLVKCFQAESKHRSKSFLKIQRLCLNMMSIHTKKGLYLLAYKPLLLDVLNRTLVARGDTVICREFTIEGKKQSVRAFLDAEETELLDEFDRNSEIIKDKITANCPEIPGVDDMPYVLSLGMEGMPDLDNEYNAIVKMYLENAVTTPIAAFFGEYKTLARRTKSLPITLLNKKVNIDQLAAIHSALTTPLLYVQGPPGSGKTNTIINTIATAYFNEKTVLLCSYNNHPVDGVVTALENILYKKELLPFPILRLGNNEKVWEAMQKIRRLYERTKSISIYEKTLERNKEEEARKAERLTQLLKTHARRKELVERKATIDKLAKSTKNLTFTFHIQLKQLRAVETALEKTPLVNEEDAFSLAQADEKDFLKYLYYVSARRIKRLDEPKYKDLIKILFIDDPEEAVREFNRYISVDENMVKLLRVFPVVATTNISAYKLGEPKPYFDMVIMDEAGQCNTAVSLVPILRGKNLMLVGDPQQLKPVVLLDPKDNKTLMDRYEIDPEYDYLKQSVYEVFLARDPLSEEVLLSYHYRCHPKIIEFNNKKYYNGKLNIRTNNTQAEPLIYIECREPAVCSKNTSPAEAREIVRYIETHPESDIGVITPFVAQRKLIQELLEEKGLQHIPCGTVHTFQGDEKDEILFSPAITSTTRQKTYDWLKNNKELINVAVSRPRHCLLLFSDSRELERLHGNGEEDDLYDLCGYIISKGVTRVSSKPAASRALGIKPYSTQTEEAFMQSLKLAIDNIFLGEQAYSVKKEVPISHVFADAQGYNDLFFTGRFDFVVYAKQGTEELPVLAIELDGKEHTEDEVVMERDRKKNELCRRQGLTLIRVPNNYARRYHHIKSVLIEFFEKGI